MYDNDTVRCTNEIRPEAPGLCNQMQTNREMLMKAIDMAQSIETIVSGPEKNGCDSVGRMPECLSDEVLYQADAIREIINRLDRIGKVLAR